MDGTDSKDVKVNSTGQIKNNVIVQDHIEIANKSMMVLYAILAVQINCFMQYIVIMYVE